MQAIDYAFCPNKIYNMNSQTIKQMLIEIENVTN